MYAIYQSVNKLISQSVNQCLGLSVNQWASKLFRRSASQSVFSSSVSPSASQSVSQSVSLPVSWSVNVQSISQSVSSSVNKSVGQPWSQSVFSPPVSHPISMSTSQSIGLKSFNSLLIGWSFSSPLTWLIFVLCEKETRYFFTPWQYRSNSGKCSTWKNWLTYWTGVDCQLQVPWRLSTILLSNQYEVLVTHKIGSIRKKKDYNKSNFLLSMI